MHKFNAHKSVRILTGKYAKAVGEVIECRDETKMVKVRITGCLNNVPVDVVDWFQFVQVESNG
jgi:transcription antitermination factor NusG